MGWETAMAWKVKKSDTHKFDRYTIIKDEVVLPNKEEKTFAYIDFSNGVCVLAVTEDKQVLCLQQYRHAIKSWQWELPAGMIDPEDDTPLEAAKRELEEETGYKAHSWTSLGSFYPSPGSTNEEIYLFLATDLAKSVQSLESSEQIEVHLVEWEQLKKLISSGEFQHGGGMAAILRYLALGEY
jgi:ADP-ribose pyrophosphatase